MKSMCIGSFLGVNLLFRHFIVAISMMRMLLRMFGSLIATTLTSASHGVDISREER
jgi:hypothetical protein